MTLYLYPLSRRRWLLKTIAVVLIGLCLLGCTGPRSAEVSVMNEAAALGTWEYTARGPSGLQEGTFQVSTEGDRLVVTFQDRWRGRITGRVRVHGSRMELRLNRLRISGRIRNERFTGSVEHDPWDLSESRRQNRSGSFVAQRIDGPGTSDDVQGLDCPPLLRESSYACSPLDIQ